MEGFLFLASGIGPRVRMTAPNLGWIPFMVEENSFLVQTWERLPFSLTIAR